MPNIKAITIAAIPVTMQIATIEYSMATIPGFTKLKDKASPISRFSLG
jgi:hypothetical protein